MREFRRIARRRAALLQYERDERDAFTSAYGDVVRAYATDDTEALRQHALTVFAAFQTRAYARDLSILDSDSTARRSLGRAASSSYLPASGPDAARLRRDLRALFDRYASDGTVELAMVTFVLIADW